MRLAMSNTIYVSMLKSVFSMTCLFRVDPFGTVAEVMAKSN